mgnify:CR=1 FL=1
MLVLVVGKATRLAKFLSASDKSYDAIVRFGFATDTARRPGAAGRAGQRCAQTPSREAIDAALDAFRGTFMQQPPAFSAKKVDGQRSYKLARVPAPFAAHRAASRPCLPSPASHTPSRHISIDILEGATRTSRSTLRVDCSAGFYIRSLAHDLGQRLGVGRASRGAASDPERRLRTRSGAAARRGRNAIRAAAESALVPLSGVLRSWPSVVLTADGAARVGRGQDVRPIDHEPVPSSAISRFVSCS